MPNANELAEVFKALSDPLRVKLLRLLANNKRVQKKDLCVCELAEELNVSQPNVSHHLKILKQAELVRCEKSDTYCYYAVNMEKILKVFKSFQNDIHYTE